MNSAENGQTIGAASASAEEHDVVPPENAYTIRSIATTIGAEKRIVISHTSHMRLKLRTASAAERERPARRDVARRDRRHGEAAGAAARPPRTPRSISTTAAAMIPISTAVAYVHTTRLPGAGSGRPAQHHEADDRQK